MRWRLLLLCMLLPGCIPQGHPQPRRPLPARPVPLRLPDHALKQCQADLGRAGVSFQALPDRSFGGGCDAISAVKLVSVGTPVANLGAMRCPLALAFSSWVQRDAQPQAETVFGQPLRRIESFGTYACRPVNGQAGARLSEHAHANAVDIAAFTLADGTRFTVKDGWNGRTRGCAPICAPSTTPAAAGSGWCSGPMPTPITMITSTSIWRAPIIVVNPDRFPAAVPPPGEAAEHPSG